VLVVFEGASEGAAVPAGSFVVPICPKRAMSRPFKLHAFLRQSRTMSTRGSSPLRDLDRTSIALNRRRELKEKHMHTWHFTGLTGRALIAGAVAGMLAAGTAFAHHGWAWTEDEPFELTGIIEEIYIGNPHVTLKVGTENGVWDVDLAPLSRSLAAGFDEDAATIGDEVTCVGFRSRNHDELHMKAARVIVNGSTYDVYPDRVPSI
jgi:hypothetical protein